MGKWLAVVVLCLGGVFAFYAYDTLAEMGQPPRSGVYTTADSAYIELVLADDGKITGYYTKRGCRLILYGRYTGAYNNMITHGFARFGDNKRYGYGLLAVLEDGQVRFQFPEPPLDCVAFKEVTAQYVSPLPYQYLRVAREPVPVRNSLDYKLIDTLRPRTLLRVLEERGDTVILPEQLVVSKRKLEVM